MRSIVPDRRLVSAYRSRPTGVKQSTNHSQCLMTISGVSRTCGGKSLNSNLRKRMIAVSVDRTKENIHKVILDR